MNVLAEESMNVLAKEIEKILAEAVGDFLAKAILNKNCTLLGINRDLITPDKMSPLLQNIQRSVTFFDSEETAQSVAARMLAAVK